MLGNQMSFRQNKWEVLKESEEVKEQNLVWIKFNSSVPEACVSQDAERRQTGGPSNEDGCSWYQQAVTRADVTHNITDITWHFATKTLINE